MAKNNNSSSEAFERKLFKAAEYKHVVLGLIFLKYISDSFEELHQKLAKGEGEYQGADPEDQDEYRGENVFWVPQNARWSHLHSHSKLPIIGIDIDEAMEEIEKENPVLKGILPKVYARPNLDKAALGGLIDLIGDTAIGDEAAKSKDILGRVYEYFLGEFAKLEEIQKHKFVMPPGRYVGIPEEEDDGIPFEDKMADLMARLSGQMKRLKSNLAILGLN